MITTLFVESEEPLICAAGMPVCGGKLVVQYGYHQELRIGHLGHEGLFVDEETGACVEDEDGKVTHWAWIDALPELSEVET
ncbi:hypothetical protein GYE84_003329 [Salmonella enterica subsp. enterica serovar Bareilly]|uniref:hypothetical protein n=1 Tax=Salmonella enterica TaxID=28901 RepID=UPI0009AC14D1|nr:hypothetical protein [Salmonella enterica]EEH3272967.1 hypothetical protein [Salmonella enterica subsp. enterica serovar Bareilly]EEJ6503645.1 hypothetical protein [Salmonella enterica subsp. enterica serovar Braenderup]EJT8611639.1 hypothetical protein [Salmonella enterica subsp. enterica serovar Newport]EEL2952960.1 hypothetical protein [Salmonella enterica]MDJ3960189.1 hypothetical protein [Salmonella enterica]